MTSSKAKYARSGARARYHHGTLRDALIRAADEILTEQGVERFSLREAARRARVSPAAPAHHFGGAAGLLTEIAIAGFEELTRRMQEAGRAETSPAARLRAQGAAYVHFALDHPGRFQLMFRHDLTLAKNERLAAAGAAAMAEVEASVAANLSADMKKAPDKAKRSLLLGAWSVVHGFAHLALDGKFTKMAQPRSLSAFVADELPAMLRTLWPDSQR
jgi:AcrR family transcriptional regulator